MYTAFHSASERQNDDPHLFCCLIDCPHPPHFNHEIQVILLNDWHSDLLCDLSPAAAGHHSHHFGQYPRIQDNIAHK